MNTKLFKSKMVLNGDTNDTLARAISLSPQRCSAKTNATGGAQFTQNEIMAIMERWTLSAEELVAVFFSH